MTDHPRPFGFAGSAPPRRVLFLCTHNSARSQIAEALARSIAPEGAQVWSAGSEPGTLHPMAVEVLKEIGVDASDQRAKRIDEIPWAEADTVVTLCAEADESCPTLGESVRRVHWPLPDPSRTPEPARLDAFRATRDEIRWRVSSLWPGGS